MKMMFSRSSFVLEWIVLLGVVGVVGVLGVASVGCAGRSTLREAERPTSRPVGNLGKGVFDERVEAFVVPPTGWTIDKEQVTDEHTHLVWLSPTGDTAYGVIYFRVPAIAALVPNGKFLHERALSGFMDQYAQDQGEATLISQEWDDERNAMRFVAEGGLYKIRPILSVRGRSGWSVYAGTLSGNTERPAELEVAVRAREATRVGLDAAGGAEAAARVLRSLLPATTQPAK